MSLPPQPSKKLAVVACMDARLDPAVILGLEQGEAHVIRNAGGVITDDVRRSLLISQRMLDTTEIVLIHHTKCGMAGLDEDKVRADVKEDVGEDIPFPLYGFTDVEQDVRDSIAALRTDPLLPERTAITGYVWDTDTDELRKVE